MGVVARWMKGAWMAEASPGARIGRTLRALREERLMSRPVLAERAGVHFITIDHIERGFVARPRRTTLEKLAKPLGVGVEDLTGPPRPLVPPLVLHTMYGENDEGIRRSALEAATDDERAAYRAELDRALGRAEAALLEDATSAAAAPGEEERRAYAGRRTVLRRYLGRLAALSDEAAGVESTPPSQEEVAEIMAHSGVGASA
jgi:transcriptional regulator with XRE-family HTH domain